MRVNGVDLSEETGAAGVDLGHARVLVETYLAALNELEVFDSVGDVDLAAVDVEFGHDAVVAYDREKARPLVGWLRSQSEDIVFEAHSTDYQLPGAYGELVEDGFAILKVGPALTFAMREALVALEDIESELIAEEQRSNLSGVLEETMLREPADWQSYYSGSPAEQKLLRLYSYSDRIRYYWHRPKVVAAVDRLIANMSSVTIPESMCSRYLPAQYARLREGEIGCDPVSMIVDRIRDVLRVYAAACNCT